MTKQATKTDKARGQEKPDVPFYCLRPIETGALDPIRQGTVE